ncbi:MAG TPA: hypothetical protein VK474_05075, partial [Chthoniobacterales bacterium]|nr:hypothetical protein [Chthoniobacterales bacterium]
MRTASRLHQSASLLCSLAILVASSAVAAAADVDLYLSDTVAGAVLRVAPDRTQTTFTSIGNPRGLAFDRAGNLYVADNAAQSIIKVTPAGVANTFVSGVGAPRGIAFDAGGNLYVADNTGNAILKFTPAGVRSTFASGLATPADVAFDPAGNLFVSDRGSGSIIKLTPAGARSTFATGLNLPAGLAFDSHGNLYEADQGTLSLFKFAPNGSRTTFATLNGGAEGDSLYRLAIDADDNVFLSASFNLNGSFIYRYTPAGVRSTFTTTNNLIGFLAFGRFLPGPPSQFLNISTRLRVLTGDNVLIGGFIITGTGPKKVLIRGIGPSLPVAGKLQNPTLELFNGANVSIAMNDNWKDTQRTEIEATTIPPANDLESALVRTLAPGHYTTVLRGQNGGTGVGLVEVYDLVPDGLSHLANISTRGLVGTGDNVMIGGVIIGGGSTGAMARVIVRAIGPSLAGAGVAGSLSDPTLELRNSQGALVAQNDNWKSAQEQEIRDTTVPPTD